VRKKETRSAAGIDGFFSALPTPLREDGRPDVRSLDALIEFLLEKGVEGFCAGGLTGEYPILGIEDRIQIYRHVAKRTGGRVPLIFGVGSENSSHILEMAKEARNLGAVAVLLPPPAFFHFAPIDAQEMMGQIGATLPLPVILYYIPQFANSLGVSDALALLGSVANIVGIKDSSGDSTALAHFAAARRAMGFRLFAGNDNLLLSALDSQADGCISGLSSMAPELMLGLYRAFSEGSTQRAADLQGLVWELAAAVNELPVAWGIKIALEAQGFPMGPFSWPCGSDLATRISRFRQWYEQWAPLVRERLSDQPSSTPRLP
jgi:4-hydroxy-tetrahydrodipicolinate synthase